MQIRRISLIAIAFVAVASTAWAVEYLTGIDWQKPPIIKPGDANTPPSDAVVLFDGTDLSKWHNGENWSVQNGVAYSGKGMITSKDEFGDCQLHIEWASPSEVKGDSQGRGNSGVFMMGKYELQILDSYDNETYFDGQASAIYKQTPPMANAMRPPGEWNTYDILWTGPRFNDDGSLESPAYITVLHNGVVTLNHFELLGDTPFHRPPQYQKHADKGPISLQDHGNPVRFRNIWVREMKPPQGKQAREPFLREDDGKETPIPEGPKVSATDKPGEKQADVEVDGQVSINGKPLALGKVLLTLQGENKGLEATVNDGKFQVGQVAPGKYRVAIQSGVENLPAKFTDSDHSGLTVELSVGKNEIEFNLITK